MKVVTVKVELEEGDELKEPEPKLDAGEHIEKRIVAVECAYAVFSMSNSSSSSPSQRSTRPSLARHRSFPPSLFLC
jgi:hypothetical protein